MNPCMLALCTVLALVLSLRTSLATAAAPLRCFAPDTSAATLLAVTGAATAGTYDVVVTSTVVTDSRGQAAASTLGDVYRYVVASGRGDAGAGPGGEGLAGDGGRERRGRERRGGDPRRRRKREHRRRHRRGGRVLASHPGFGVFPPAQAQKSPRMNVASEASAMRLPACPKAR